MSRGRKEGSTSGKRPIFWVCISNKNELIVEKIYSPSDSSDEDIKNFTEELASKAYFDLYGEEPDRIIGPCYDVKSLNKSSNNFEKKENIENFNLKKANISSVLGPATYNGWHGTAFEISGKSDEVLFIASERTDSNLNKILPNAIPLKKDLINFLME